MCYASSYIQRGAHFIVTNGDHYNIVGGRRMPEGGSCASAIQLASNTKPIVTGKPNPFVAEMFFEKYGV